MMQARRAYRAWWQGIQTLRPWAAGMVIGVCVGLGYAAGAFLVSLGYHRDGTARDASMVVGAATAFVVASIVRGALNRRKAGAARPDPRWPAPYGRDESP